MDVHGITFLDDEIEQLLVILYNSDDPKSEHFIRKIKIQLEIEEDEYDCI